MKPDNNTRCRLVVKAVVWETISNLACFGLAYWIFGNVGGCAVFSVICFAVKLMLYYEHERVWGRISWGKRYGFSVTIIGPEQPEMWDEEYHKIFDEEYQ